MYGPIEKLRRIWTPEREIDEIFSDLSPGTELDSIVRELFSRIVYSQKSFELDITEPLPEFDIRWEIIHTPPPNPRRKIAIWEVPR